MRISSIQSYSYKRQKNPNFSADSSPVNNLPSDILSLNNTNKSDIPWVKDKNFIQSLNYLNNLEFDKNDVRHVQSLGVVLPFLDGKEAVNFIKKNRVGIEFAPLVSENIHAQYDYDDNCIKISDRYKDTQNIAEVIAISEAILHEAGHAKDQNGESSIQEEIDCLSMNALSHRTFDKKYHDVFANSDSLIIQEGVCVYSKLFFDEDPLKLALVKRLIQKYGQLPAGNLQHSPSPLAIRVKEMQN